MKHVCFGISYWPDGARHQWNIQARTVMNQARQQLEEAMKNCCDGITVIISLNLSDFLRNGITLKTW